MNPEDNNVEDLTEYEADELADLLKEEKSKSSKKERIGLENHLFTWNGWDDDGPMTLQFYNVELLVQIGEFPKGHKFDVAFFNGDESLVSFMNNDSSVEHRFELHLTAGKKIEEVDHNNLGD